MLSPPSSGKILPYGERKDKEIPNFDGLECTGFIRQSPEQYALQRVKEGQSTMFTLQHSAFESYCDALEGAGPKLKELILDRAANDEDISL